MVHYDLKGDNVLLEPLADTSDAEFASPPSAVPPFRVVLADFGEAKAYGCAASANTVRTAKSN